ncbi:MAG: T9SS type A sorting domain-containing protein [Prevotellaceae bacterium]|jgi:hypothetical protein|nr:T9SS type A sorting domain-containing protein [Prevotellaceae bacterium]
MKKTIFLFIATALAFIQAAAFTYKGQSIDNNTEFVRATQGNSPSSLKEISGMACSRTTPDYFWVELDDPDDDNRIYALNSNGTLKLTLTLGGLKMRDWEDICLATVSNKNYILIGGFGDNDGKFKGDYHIYVFEEPAISGSSASVSSSAIADIKFSYPDGNAHNAEALMYDPVSNLILVVDKYVGKSESSNANTVFSTPFRTTSATVTLTEVQKLGNNGEAFNTITAADISADGQHILIRNVNHILYWRRQAAAESFATVIARNPQYIATYNNADTKGESVAWSNDALKFYTVSDEKGSSTIYSFSRASIPPLNAETSDTATPTGGDYWINDDMGDFPKSSSNVATANRFFKPKTATENICFTPSAVEVEDVPGNCKDPILNNSKILLVDGTKDNGKLEFTVPNAQRIRIYVGAKSSTADRYINIAVTGKSTVKISNLNKDNCNVYDVTHNSPTPLTVTITGGSTSDDKNPVAIHGIQVWKYNPTLNISTTAISGFGYAYGESSVVKSFTVSGTQLANDITVSLPANSKYEISKNSTSGYAQSLTFNRSSNAVATSTVYVRLKEGQNVGTYSDEISISTVYNTKNSSNCNTTTATLTEKVQLNGSVTCGSRTLSFPADLPTEVYSNHGTISAVATPSAGAGEITYYSTDENVAAVSNGTITVKTAGEIKFYANIAANGNYCSALSAEHTLSIRQLLAEYLLEKGITADFDQSLWKVKYNDNAEWESTPVAISVNDNSVRKITVLGAANVPADTYKTQDIEIGAQGSLDLSAGSLTVSGDLIITSADNTAGQLKVAPSAVLNAANVKVKKDFLNGIWYMLSFPFDIVAVTDQNGTVQTLNKTVNGKGVYAETYDTQNRATRSHKEDTNSPSWTSTGEQTTLDKNKGYLFGQDLGAGTTLYFTAKQADTQEAFAVLYKTCSVTPTPSAHELHTGWNLIGNPHTVSYDLTSLVPTYVYNINTKDYDEACGNIEPFKAFFVQVTENAFEFVPEAASLRRARLLVSAYDEIKLGISKDPSFTDYYRLRLTDNESATEGYDFNIDAVKMLSTRVPQIYRETAYTDYAIDVMPCPVQRTGKIIPLAYAAPAAGTYTITYEAGSENIAELVLMDKKENTETDLLTTPAYSFTTVAAESANSRFDLLVKLWSESGVITATAERNADNITLAAADGQIILHGLQSPSTVSLFDLAGRQTAIYENIGNKQIIRTANKGIYIVRIVNPAQSAAVKVILK